MADENNAASNNEATSTDPVFAMQRVYLKDLSLEMPNAPQIFLEQETPTVEVSLNVGGERLAETVFEATVTGTQAGIFEIANVPEEQFEPLIGIVCPTMLFPYLRANVADAINRTSLPPLHLAEVNFQALYEQRAQEAQSQAGGNGTPDSGSGIYVPPGTTRQ